MKPRGHNYCSSFLTKINCQPDTKLICITTLKVLCLQYAHFKLPSRNKIKKWQKQKWEKKSFFFKMSQDVVAIKGNLSSRTSSQKDALLTMSW